MASSVSAEHCTRPARAISAGGCHNWCVVAGPFSCWPSYDSDADAANDATDKPPEEVKERSVEARTLETRGINTIHIARTIMSAAEIAEQEANPLEE